MNGLVPPSWAEAVALAAFLVSAAVFGLILIAIFRLPGRRLERLERFPLEREDTHSHEHQS